MATHADLTKILKARLMSLIESYQNLKETNLHLSNEVKSLKLQKEALEYENQALKAQNKEIKTAQSLLESDANQKAKAKINELVREIDRCFAILNQ